MMRRWTSGPNASVLVLRYKSRTSAAFFERYPYRTPSNRARFALASAVQMM